MLQTKAESFLKKTREIAAETSQLLMKSFESPLSMTFKGEINPVTEVDRRSEAFIVDRLRKTFPGTGIVAEEGALVETKSSLSWMVDPLDGTTNYAHGFCLFSVSLALLEDNKSVLGVIVIPKLKEEFYACDGGGAFLNDTQISVSKESNLGKAFLTTGVPYSVRENVDFHLGLQRRFFNKSLAIRRGGSACIDLCYVACGKFDGYWEAGLQPWDAAAGILIVKEAGGNVSDFQGNPYALKKSNNLLADNGYLHKAMLEVLAND